MLNTTGRGTRPIPFGRSAHPMEFAEVHGVVEPIERCRRCGAIGRAYYAHDGWGFTPRTSCGNPLKCGDKPNAMGGPLLLIAGGRA